MDFYQRFYKWNWNVAKMHFNLKLSYTKLEKNIVKIVVCIVYGFCVCRRCLEYVYVVCMCVLGKMCSVFVVCSKSVVCIVVCFCFGRWKFSRDAMKTVIHSLWDFYPLKVTVTSRHPKETPSNIISLGADWLLRVRYI